MNTMDADVVGKTEVLKSHIRYAQSLAMHTSSTWGIEFSGGTYTLFSRTGGTRTNRTLPNEDAETVAMPRAMTATGTIAFDSHGKPYTDAALTTRYAGGLLTGITITQDTGFVP
jgi:MSHA pilin protein MshC